jgi:hypothetical protein
MCRYPRKLEPNFVVSRHIAEFWNTLSNLPFVVLGVLRLVEGQQPELQYAYQLMILAGIASAIHHATTPKWTIVIDWIPIVLSMVHIWTMGYYGFISWATYFKFTLALVVLVTDHIWTLVPVPWGHVMWHLLAAYSIDDLYQDVIINAGIASEYYLRHQWLFSRATTFIRLH